MKTKEVKPSGAAKPVSLAPLKFEDALRGMLTIPPPAKEPKASTKKKTAKRKR